MKLSSSLAVSAMVAVAVVVVLTLSEASMRAEAVTCSVLELSPCLDPIRLGTPPSESCCQKLREQKPCLCGYLRDPAFSPFVSNPNAKKVASTCGVPWPQC